MIQYPQIEVERLAGSVAVALEKARDKAIADKANFAFESNFSNDMAIDITLAMPDMKPRLCILV